MDLQLSIKIDEDKIKGLEYVKKVIETMKTIRGDMPPELIPHCRNTLGRMCELAESLEIGWRAWFTDEFNRSLQHPELLKSMTICEKVDTDDKEGYRFNYDD